MPWLTTKIAATALIAALLAGCATNASRLDRGHEVGVAGAAAIGSTRDFFTQVRTARDEANIALVANNTDCAWTSSIILAGSPTAQRTCLPLGKAAADGDVVVSLKPIDEHALRPTISAIAALAAYLDAVNGIVDAKSPDIAAQLADAFQLATVAQTDLATITKVDIKLIPALSADQQSAITALVKLIGDLAAEQRKARELGELAKRQNPEVQAVIKALRKQVELWGKSSLAGDLQLSDTTFTALGRQLGNGQPADPAARAAVIRKIVAAKRATDSVPVVIATVDAALGEMARAQDDLIRAYSANPNWTAAERAKQAKLNRERLLGALHAVAGIFAAFAI